MQTVVAANLRHDLATGAFHAARGRLSADGEALLQIFKEEMEKLCASGVVPEEDNQNNIARLEKEISKAG